MSINSIACIARRTWRWVIVVTTCLVPIALFMAKRAQARTVQIRAGHLVIIAQPGAVTRLIVAAANATAH